MKQEFILKDTGKELKEAGMIIKSSQDPEEIIVCRSGGKIYVNKKKCTPRFLLEVVVQELCMSVSDDTREEEIVTLVHETLEAWETVSKNLE